MTAADDFEQNFTVLREELELNGINWAMPERGTDQYWGVLAVVAQRLGLRDDMVNDLYARAQESHDVRAARADQEPRAHRFDHGWLVVGAERDRDGGWRNSRRLDD